MATSDIQSRMDDLARTAVALRAERGFNCAQAVACALAPEVGADFETCYLLSEGFGAGMGGHRETCGAISGAVMALSHLNSSGTETSGTTKVATYRLVHELVQRFGEMNGTTCCAELKGIGCDHGPLRSCPGCIEDAVKIAVDIIAHHEQTE